MFLFSIFDFRLVTHMSRRIGLFIDFGLVGIRETKKLGPGYGPMGGSNPHALCLERTSAEAVVRVDFPYASTT